MRKRHISATALLAVSTAALTPIAAHADASDPVTLFVSSINKSCSDAGPGTVSTAPYCSLQAAADAASPGDTVMIEGGTYANVDLTTSGTADAPITIETPGFTSRASFIEPASGTTPALKLDHVSYVNLKNLFFGNSDAQMVYVDGSHHVTMDNIEGGIEIAGGLSNPTDSSLPGIEVAGDSSAITISRGEFVDNGRYAPTIQVDAGGSDDVITTNGFEGGRPAISVDGTPGTDIVSNTVLYSTSYTCGTAVSLTGASTGSYIENNVLEPSNQCSSSTNPTGLLDVAADAAAGTTVDYNVLNPNENWATGPGTVEGPDEYAYEWGSQFYKTVAAFTAASSQGQHDIIGNPEVGNAWGFNFFENVVTSPALNSANSDAPGELALDLNNKSRVADPLVPQTGAGTYGYYDRGASQLQPTASTTVTTTANGALGVTATNTAWLSDGWSFDFGDGTKPASGAYGVASHTYAKPGTYTITVTGTSMVNGQPFTGTGSFTTAGSDYTPLGPTRILDTRKGLGAAKAKVAPAQTVSLNVAGAGSIPADATAVALNVTVTDTTGNGYVSVIPSGGYLSVSNLNYLKGQTITNAVIVPVGPDGTIQLIDMGPAGGSVDLIADVSGYFTRTAGSGYTAVTPARILDTRHGTGAPTAEVAPNSGLPVGIAGADSIPAGATAVALHVTVTDTAGNGWIAAEPDGAGTPTTSNLNYLKGQTVANTVIVPVAADGKIELYNGGGTGSVDLIADVAGYFSTDSTDVYTAVTPYRAWDSRKSGTALTAGGTATYTLDQSEYNSTVPPTIPAGASLITNLTVTDMTANGFVTAFPAGTARPGVSNLNYLAGQTVAGLSLLATTGADQQISVYNESAGHGDVILDVFGFFSG